MPFDVPITPRELVMNRYALPPHGVNILGRRNPHGDRVSTSYISQPAGRVDWQRGVDDNRQYTYFENAFHSLRSRLGDGNQHRDAMGGEASYSQCNQYECGWETRPEYLVNNNNAPMAMLRIFRDEYLSSDATVERRKVNSSLPDGGHEEFDEYAGPGRCECKTLRVVYDVPYYDYPPHSARDYRLTLRRDGAAYPTLSDPTVMHGNPAGDYNLWMARSAQGAGHWWREAVYYIQGRWQIKEVSDRAVTLGADVDEGWTFRSEPTLLCPQDPSLSWQVKWRSGVNHSANVSA